MGYYERESRSLEMYQRLIQYWTMTFSRKGQIRILDNMNFNLSLFPHVLHPDDVGRLYPLEPGYGSPDGSTELRQIIAELEYARLVNLRPEKATTIRKVVDAAGIGCGNGCTNVMNAVLNSIVRFSRPRLQKMARAGEVVLTLPNYTVYTAQVSHLSGAVEPRYIHARRENGFLPTLEEVEQATTDKTIALILTYPNNPAQSTYEGASVAELKKILAFCQSREIFLVVDNIYQDLIFPKEREFAEIFSLTESLDYVVKIYGSSKDTPFFSGFRTGYWFGDPRLEQHYRYYISATENSLNTVAMVMFGLGLYFKSKMILGGSPEGEDMRLFSNGLFGWSQIIDRPRLFDRMVELNLFEKYRQRIDESNEIQESTLAGLIAYVEQSRCFIDYVNQRIGNVFFVRVDPRCFGGHDDDFFTHLLQNAHYGVLPGNVFGMPLTRDEVWFRMTTIHDSAENLIDHMSRLEEFLLT